jgi:dCMP deaminase
MKCATCGSEGFEPSILRGRCTFCDGTEGGNPPTRPLRPTRDQYLMGLAMVASMRSTCLRGSVGCVLADHRGRVLAIGNNGNASGLPHCNDITGFNFVYANGINKRKQLTGQATAMMPVYGNACVGHDRPPGEPTECAAVHAEQNAILQCGDPDRITTAYCTRAPCRTCTKLLLNTLCRRIVWHEPHEGMEEARKLWVDDAGREWEQLKD